jgi:cell division topological specificity factor
MKLLNFFKPRGTAPVARERLQILLAHERITLGPRNLIAILRDEILATIAKHVEIAPDALTVKMGQAGSVSTLEIDVEIPTEKVSAKPAHQEATLAKAAVASR